MMLMHSQDEIRLALTKLMTPGTWYSVDDLITLIEHGVALDDEDNELVPSGEIRFKRTVKNAFRKPRRDGNWEWNGEKHSSKYRIPPLSDGEEPVIPYPDIATRAADDALAPISNTGFEAELFVEELLENEGWIATNIRYAGYGYDIIAKKGDTEIHVEVKSSGRKVQPHLTENEFYAADRLRESYWLALVDNWDGDKGDITYVVNPISALKFKEIQTLSFRFSRVD